MQVTQDTWSKFANKSNVLNVFSTCIIMHSTVKLFNTTPPFLITVKRVQKSGGGGEGTYHESTGRIGPLSKCLLAFSSIEGAQPAARHWASWLLELKPLLHLQKTNTQVSDLLQCGTVHLQYLVYTNPLTDLTKVSFTYILLVASRDLIALNTEDSEIGVFRIFAFESRARAQQPHLERKP